MKWPMYSYPEGGAWKCQITNTTIIGHGNNRAQAIEDAAACLQRLMKSNREYLQKEWGEIEIT